MRGRIGAVVFAMSLGALLSRAASAGPICVDPGSCGGPVGCTSDADCSVPGERCIVGFDPVPPYPPVNTCCAACPGSATPFAGCAGAFSDCDGCSFGCVDPVGQGAPVPTLSALATCGLAALLLLAMGWARSRQVFVA